MGLKIRLSTPLGSAMTCDQSEAASIAAALVSVGR
jgi:hypothetical protein